MYRFPLALAVGLTVASAAAHADTIIIQGTPSFDPAIISHGPIEGLPDLSGSILTDPAFHRLAGMCETLGLECGADQVTAEGGIAPEWTPRHIADAEKRLAQLVEDREDYAEALSEHFETLPAPIGLPAPRVPNMLFGWSAPQGFPGFAPRPNAIPHGLPRDFSHLFPQRPPVLAPRYGVPHFPDLSGFQHRLNTPGAVIPHSLLPRPSFPWRSF